MLELRTSKSPKNALVSNSNKEKYLEGETPLISDEFKARLKAHVIDGYKGNIK